MVLPEVLREGYKCQFFSINRDDMNQAKLRLPEIDPGASSFLLAGGLFPIANHRQIPFIVHPLRVA